MFELIGRILAFFYDLVPSYGFAIVMLTLLVMIVFMPLTFKSTKSMIAMRVIQPELKALQAKHADDKETLNKEMMALYQERGVNPVGGCLPVLFQAPVFYVLFRVVQGITRRTSDVGFVNGSATGYGGLARSGESDVTITAIEAPTKNFNPSYIDDITDSALYRDLINSNEMLSFGIDLSRSASEVLTTSIPSAMPYLLMVVITGFLSWFQQRQIQGRMKSNEMNAQMQMITKVMPWFLPIFAFTMPAALVVYFIVSALFRVGQQAVITRKYYDGEDLETPADDGEAVLAGAGAKSSATGKSSAAGKSNAAGKSSTERAQDTTERATTATSAATGPGGMLGTLLGTNTETAAPSNRHGSRRPVSGATSASKRARPPREAAKPAATAKSNGSDSSKPESKWAKAKRTAAGSEPASSSRSTNGSTSRRRGRQEPENKPAPSKSSKRVTAKGDGKPHSPTRNTKKKRK